MCQLSGMAKAASASMQNLLICWRLRWKWMLRAVGDGEAALLGGDFQNLLMPWSFAGAGDEGGGGAVVILHDGGDVVFDFDSHGSGRTGRSRALSAACRRATGRGRDCAGTDFMRTPPPFAFPGAAPAAGGVVVIGAEPVGDFPVDATDGTDFAAVDEVFDLLKDRRWCAC